MWAAKRSAFSSTNACITSCSLGIINNAELRILNMIISCAQKEDDEKRYNQLFIDSKIQLRLALLILQHLY